MLSIIEYQLLLDLLEQVCSYNYQFVYLSKLSGKTFTGIELTKLLKSHPDLQNKQIICLTYTNHALDQFLEGLFDYFPDIIRVGSRSRSKNEKLLERNLSKLR